MRIHVAFTPAETGPAPIGVVVDVLRATSTIAQALASGYTRVLCCAEIEDAQRIGLMRQCAKKMSKALDADAPLRRARVAGRHCGKRAIVVWRRGAIPVALANGSILAQERSAGLGASRREKAVYIIPALERAPARAD